MLIRIALVCLVLLQGACVLDESPAVRPCVGGTGYRVAADRASGGLRVLPSTVPGVEVDTAAWMTHAEVSGPGASAQLILTARLRADRPADVDGLALIYALRDSAGGAAIVDAELDDPIYTATAEERRSWDEPVVTPSAPRVLDAGQTLRTERQHHVAVGLSTGWSVPLAGCPTSVRLVRTTELALHLGSGRTWSRSGAVPPVDSARVVWDTVIDSGNLWGLMIGIVANPTDRTLERPIAALALSAPLEVPTGYTAPPPPRPTGEPPAVLEYALAPLPPGGVAGFAGGWLEYSERVVARSVRDLAPGEAWPGTEARLRSNHWIRRTQAPSDVPP